MKTYTNISAMTWLAAADAKAAGLGQLRPGYMFRHGQSPKDCGPFIGTLESNLMGYLEAGR
jgi:hypothetical protein